MNRVQCQSFEYRIIIAYKQIDDIVIDNREVRETQTYHIHLYIKGTVFINRLITKLHYRVAQ